MGYLPRAFWLLNLNSIVASFFSFLKQNYGTEFNKNLSGSIKKYVIQIGKEFSKLNT